MKKFILVMLAGVFSQAAFAAATGISSSSTPTATSVTAGTGGCAYLKEDIKVLLSADIAGAYDCGNSSVGIATRADKGKGVTWAVGSDGGAIEKRTDAVADAASAKKGS